MKDYYAILGVPPTASTHTIKVAYRRIAMQLHPDRNRGTEQDGRDSTLRMAELNEAYEVLSNAGQRLNYDIQMRMSAPAEVAEPAYAATHAGASRAEPAPSSEPGGGSAAPPAGAPAFGVVAKQTCEEFRRKVLNHFTLEWKEDKLDGFNWACTVGNWRTHYAVAAKLLPILRAAEAGKIFTYASVAVAAATRFLCTNHFLFLVFYEKAAEQEAATAAVRRISELSSGSSVVAAALVDAEKNATFFPPPSAIKDAPFRELLTTLNLR